MQPTFQIIREGDKSGDLAVVKLTSRTGISVWALGIPQPSPSRVGPTWCYLIDEEKVTLIDPGEAVSSELLVSLLRETPFHPHDVQQILITHSHSDHDGGLENIVYLTKAELWLHPLYSYLRYRPATLPRQANTIQHWMATYQQAMSERFLSATNRASPPKLDYTSQSHLINSEYKTENLQILETPGHTPDSLCIIIDNFIITGDHVLPYITPGASVRLRYPIGVPQNLTKKYPEEKYYGLSSYLKSLEKIEAFGEEHTILPGHFLTARGHIRRQTPQRARQIISNHINQSKKILALISESPIDLYTIAQHYFHPRIIKERGLERSLASIACQIDFLLEYNYLGETEDGMLFNKGVKDFDLQWAHS